MRKYRRIKRQANSKLQSYQRSLIALAVTILCYIVCLTIINANNFLSKLFILPSKFFFFAILVAIITSILSWKNREEVSKLKIKSMSKQAYKLARKIHRLFNDKQITDILKLSNLTRYGDEMPEIYVWINSNFSEGYIAIENIANYERADREKFEQRVSGILSGRFQKYAVVSSELIAGDSFILFYFEDTFTSQRLYIKDNMNFLKEFVSDDKHALKLSKDLTWHADVTAHLSIIARTRAGKSVFAGRYLARLMLLQNWVVEYNSAKYDRYVKEFNGQSDPIKIVERAEYWCTIMDNRLREINEAGKEKYLEMNDMPDIAIFFDEIGNLNASLESLDKTDKTLKIMNRWINAINKLSATGASIGIHIIAISQFATKEGFLPSLARVNCSDAVIMLGGAADSASERQYLMSGFADMPKRRYDKGQGLAKIMGSGRKWEIAPHFFETPWFNEE
ncbi:cell division protein FtsK [Streptococcus anginosus]|uniref:cell division protein FtsK n=1 Tax=Streptococcus anginosus TaxID=1328 RepID=UPI00398CCFDC